VRVTFNLVPPDLLPVSVSTPLGVSGQSVTVVTVATNQGGGVAAGYWYDGIYLSTNAVLATNATPSTYVYQNHNVGAAGLSAWTNMVSLPQLSSGTYYLFVRVADPYYSSQPYEATKTNNTSAGLALTAPSNLATSQASSFVIPTTPLLKITQYGTSVVFNWSRNAVGYSLQSKASLNSTSEWTTVTNVPVIIGDQFYVTNAIVGPSKFYRLCD
jgi:hypothetical protein